MVRVAALHKHEPRDYNVIAPVLWTKNAATGSILNKNRLPCTVMEMPLTVFFACAHRVKW